MQNENEKEYQFLHNLKRNKPFGARLEECTRLLEGTIYLDWISQSEEGEGTEDLTSVQIWCTSIKCLSVLSGRLNYKTRRVNFIMVYLKPILSSSKPILCII